MAYSRYVAPVDALGKYFIGSGAAATRRQILKAFGLAGVSALLPASAVRGQSGGTGNHRRIDVHHHYFPTPARGNQNWTPALSLEAMDKYEIATAILSGVQYGDEIYDGTEKGVALARRYNEFAAKVVSDHPDKFGFLAVLPLNNNEASLKEIAYAFDTLKADGVGILSNTGSKWPEFRIACCIGARSDGASACLGAVWARRLACGKRWRAGTLR